MDFFAVATLGAFPTPTPTASQRMAYEASYGLLSVVPTIVGGDDPTRRPSWLLHWYRRFKMRMRHRR